MPVSDFNSTFSEQEYEQRFHKSLHPFQTSEGRKTETSSDASREAPERARKDTPKEVKLHKGSYPSVRLSGVVSQAFLRRVPSPQGCATVLRLPAREICFITAAPTFIPAPQRFPIIPQNQACGGKRRTYGFAAADLSGLSLPDAPCEHTDIRGKPKNLTRDFLPPIMDAV